MSEEPYRLALRQLKSREGVRDTLKLLLIAAILFIGHLVEKVLNWRKQ